MRGIGKKKTKGYLKKNFIAIHLKLAKSRFNGCGCGFSSNQGSPVSLCTACANRLLSLAPS